MKFCCRAIRRVPVRSSNSGPKNEQVKKKNKYNFHIEIIIYAYINYSKEIKSGGKPYLENYPQLYFEPICIIRTQTLI
jgi:hypothetical protein